MKYLSVFFSFFSAYKLAKGTLVGYITGGSYAQYSEYPHAIHLHFNCEIRYICGGSILNQNLVLTAAHCFEKCSDLPDLIVGVRYGHEDVTNMNATRLQSYAVHENYDEGSVMNDIALIITRRRIPLSDTVKRVILMSSPPIKEFAYVSGWGVSEDDNTTLLLKHVRATIQPPDICQEILGWMPDGTFCAGPITGLGAAAQGDSGSALVVEGYIQIGIVSFKRKLYALVAYTNVTYHLDWITRTTKRLYCENFVA